VSTPDQPEMPETPELPEVPANAELPPGGPAREELTPEQRGFVRQPVGVGCGPIGCMYGAVGFFVVLLLMMLILMLQRLQ